MSSAPEFHTMVSAAKTPRYLGRHPSSQHPPHNLRPPSPTRLQNPKYSILTPQQSPALMTAPRLMFCPSLPYSASCVVRWRGCCSDCEGREGIERQLGHRNKKTHKEMKTELWKSAVRIDRLSCFRRKHIVWGGGTEHEEKRDGDPGSRSVKLVVLRTWSRRREAVSNQELDPSLVFLPGNSPIDRLRWQ